MSNGTALHSGMLLSCAPSASRWLLRWFVCLLVIFGREARAEFTQLSSVRGVVWYPNLSKDLVAELCGSKEVAPALVIPIAESFSCGGSDDEVVPPSGTGPLLSVQVITSLSGIQIRVSVESEDKTTLSLLDESLSSSLSPKALFGDTRMKELLQLMVLDSLPAVLPARGSAEMSARVIGLFSSVGLDTDFQSVTLSMAANEGLFRADEMVTLENGHSNSGESSRTGYLVQKSGRSGNQVRIRGELFQRLLSPTREDAERGRASAVGLFVGVAPDFVNGEPRFIWQSEVKVSLSHYLRLGFALDAIRNSTFVDETVNSESTDAADPANEQPIESTTRQTILQFNEVMLRPSIGLVSTQDLTFVGLSLSMGYAFYLQKLSPVDLTSNIFPSDFSEINDFAPSVGLGISRTFGVFRTDLFGDYSQAIGTARCFQRLTAGVNFASALSWLTLGMIGRAGYYVGISARYYSSEIGIKYDNDIVEGSLITVIPTSAVGLYLEVLI
jgi:hypothetical protein